ncbi:MAG: hypothetical protein R6W82_00300 [bacterium]
MTEASETPQHGREADLGRWIREGWELIRDDLAGYAIAAFLLVLLTSVSLAALEIVGLVVVGPLTAGFFLMTVNHMRGDRPMVGDLFQGFSRFLPVILASIILSVFFSVGVILCLLPAVFVLGVYQFTFLFIVDRGADFWEAMEASRLLARKDYLEFSLFALVLVVLNMVGAMVFVVGLLVSVPLSFAAISCAYRDLAGLAERPAVQPSASGPGREGWTTPPDDGPSLPGSGSQERREE